MAKRVCPVLIGYLLASPVRKLIHNPGRILGPHVREGMTALDVGSAMGFFSLPLASLVGPGGRVVCVDMQPGMLRSLQRRAEKAGLSGRIEPRLCTQRSLGLEGLEGALDFALLFAVLHEMPEAGRALGEIQAALRQHGRLLLAEPRGHVKEAEFETSVALAERAGLRVVERPSITRCRAVLLEKG